MSSALLVVPTHPFPCFPRLLLPATRVADASSVFFLPKYHKAPWRQCGQVCRVSTGLAPSSCCRVQGTHGKHIRPWRRGKEELLETASFSRPHAS